MGWCDGLEGFQHQRVWLLLGWYRILTDWDGSVVEAQVGHGGLLHAVAGR